MRRGPTLWQKLSRSCRHHFLQCGSREMGGYRHTGRRFGPVWLTIGPLHLLVSRIAIDESTRSAQIHASSPDRAFPLCNGFGGAAGRVPCSTPAPAPRGTRPGPHPSAAVCSLRNGALTSGPGLRTHRIGGLSEAVGGLGLTCGSARTLSTRRPSISTTSNCRPRQRPARAATGRQRRPTW
jgi:hypothetical protein